MKPRPRKRPVPRTPPGSGEIELLRGAALAEILIAGLNDGEPPFEIWLQRYLGALGKIAGEITLRYGPDTAAKIFETVKQCLAPAVKLAAEQRAARDAQPPEGEWRH